MKYWKKKIKREFNVYIKRIKLKCSYGHAFCYIAYKSDKEGYDVYEKIFKDPRDIWLKLKEEAMQDEILKKPVKPLNESDQWVEKSLKDFKK
jgi:hypothetical protein